MKLLILIGAVLVSIAAFTLNNNRTQQQSSEDLEYPEEVSTEIQGGLDADLHPLAIEAMRKREYPGSEIVLEQTLTPGSNYSKYIASYKSEGLKIFGLLTIPQGQQPKGGWPAIIFNHGYIAPEQYVTTQRYEDYVDGFARNGYIVFKSDYRGHGNSEGEPGGGYFSTAYTVDVMNALTSIKKMEEVNAQNIGMWGHSMGGSLTLRAMVLSQDIKAGVIWAGVVGSYEDIFYNWNRSTRWTPSQRELHSQRRPSRQSFVDQYGDPKDNPEFWNSLSAINYVSDISGPIQLHHGTVDTHVPIEFSEKLNEALESIDGEVEFYAYDGADHNLSGNSFDPAMNRSIKFFDEYLKPPQP